MIPLNTRQILWPMIYDDDYNGKIFAVLTII